MAMSDSTRDLYKVLQDKAARTRRARLARGESPDDTGEEIFPVRRRRAVPAKKRWRIPPIPPKVKQYIPYAIAFLALLAPLIYNPPRNNNIPKYLLGVWESSSPGYEDRYLMFSDRNVAFGTGRYQGESYLVAEVDTSAADDGVLDRPDKDRKMLVEIRYMKQDRLEYSLSLYYDPRPPATITFKNQDTLRWTKKKGAKT